MYVHNSCVCMYIYIHIYIYIYIIYMYVCMYISVCVCVCVYASLLISFYISLKTARDLVLILTIAS